MKNVARIYIFRVNEPHSKLISTTKFGNPEFRFVIVFVIDHTSVFFAAGTKIDL